MMVAAGAMMIAGSAQAVLLDFTDGFVPDGRPGTIATSRTVFPFVLPDGNGGSFTLEVYSVTGMPTFGTAATAPTGAARTGICSGDGGPLACIDGGLGVADDHLIFTGELVVIDVIGVASIEITDIYLLNFLNDGGSVETAQFDYDGGDFDDTFTANSSGSLAATPGSPAAAASSRIILTANTNPVGDGASFSLGGFEITAGESDVVIPLPGALPLLLTGLAGIGFLSRRRGKA